MPITPTTGPVVDADRLLYTPSDFAKSSLLYLQECGRLTALAPHRSAREDLTSYLFFIVTKGSGTLGYAGRTYAVAAGDCVFIDCRHSYYQESSADLWQLSWCHFAGRAMPTIYQKYLERGGAPVFHPHDPQALTAAWTRLNRTAREPAYVRDMAINARLADLMTCLMAESWHPEHRQKGDKQQQVAAVRDFLDSHYPQRITLDALAARFYINKYYLTRLFKAAYGVSINQYLQERRITAAKQQLRFTDRSVAAIATACGFADTAYFARVFKQVEGVSGREYRKRW
ncbi:helix-turn-helix transcriptional regulator [Lacticaseibacillus parakribbianus]|uniref:helix-turn-helix transcriptional regulator n=1 Tax=Lacticaseibacillus parakribbianus TaxID=2970927 RepID=UPI0021CB0962|nr:AraC family transcriptional regulator [Lacticaseibacillus parakribbianus]